MEHFYRWGLCTLFFSLLLQTSSAQSPQKVDRIVVDKSKRTLSLYVREECIKSYNIALGFSPTGHKLRQGDGKTPEGLYTISGKNPHSLYHRSLRVSYPAPADRKSAAQKGYDPGGDIMIHGLAKEVAWMGKKHWLKNWTLGCIAVTNSEMEEIFARVDVGTQIEILP